VHGAGQGVRIASLCECYPEGLTEPFLAHWQIRDGWATSAQIPGVRIPGGPFMGVSGVAPSAEKLAEWTAREQRVIDRGLALPPDPTCGGPHAETNGIGKDRAEQPDATVGGCLAACHTR
jgi:acetamidase/formamidase